MITVEEHLERILDQIEPVDAVTLPVPRTLGMVTTTDVHSRAELPRFDNSSMDGYAVRHADLDGASAEHPVMLPVVADIAAGDPASQRLGPGQAMRIMTGAPVPPGADTVVRLEDTDGHEREPQFRAQPPEGANIRRAGEDVRPGDLLVPRRTRIGPAQIAVLVSAGVHEIEVVRQVRVAVFSTGDELVPPGEPVGPGQIVDSNGPMLEALVREAGAEVVHVGRLADVEGQTTRQIEARLEDADLIVTTGGVSKGAFDIVKKVLTGQGSMKFVEVAMQPGKPQGFGLLGSRRVPVFTLPGNPVSALVSFEVFVRPALESRGGRRVSRQTATGLATEPWASASNRQTYTRVRVSRDSTGAYAVTPVGGPGSHLLGGLAQADALAVSDAETDQVSAGAEVDLILLRPRREIEGRLEDDAAPGTT
ncbi:molybdopterin molybdotransferase MoeA [Ornithinimicrobium sufpigmenti]|uniref:molybdopterin molybdotransferase MoeA n=1 Tax=Ornithinimicrobium sufpigmenti TaxID=2508882 RepID=UPI001035866A|nr:MULTISPECIES: gephyrin-like molybdotransferase Glp [unclassified Ornithinimicrobium]